jgi:hypothetical protein
MTQKFSYNADIVLQALCEYDQPVRRSKIRLATGNGTNKELSRNQVARACDELMDAGLAGGFKTEDDSQEIWKHYPTESGRARVANHSNGCDCDELETRIEELESGLDEVADFINKTLYDGLSTKFEEIDDQFDLHRAYMEELAEIINNRHPNFNAKAAFLKADEKTE